MNTALSNQIQAVACSLFPKILECFIMLYKSAGTLNNPFSLHNFNKPLYCIKIYLE